MTYSAQKLAAGTIPMALQVTSVGGDLLAVLTGGTSPHIGTAVLALPRPSLANPEETSSTSSVLNVTGHKDEALCRMAAERLCAHFGVTVVCTGGVHIDSITADQLAAVSETAKALVDLAAQNIALS